MVLLYNTSRLLMMKPEPGVNMPSTPGGSMTNTPDTPEGEQGNYRWWMTPRYRTPRRFAEVEKAVKLFIANLPPRFKDPMRPKADGDGFEVDIEALSLVRACCKGRGSAELIVLLSLLRTHTLQCAACTWRTLTTIAVRTRRLSRQPGDVSR